MANQACGRSQNGNGLSNTRVPLKAVLPGESADMQVLALLTDIAQLVQTVDVHNYAGGGQPHIEERHQALPPGKNFRLVAIPAKNRHRLLK